MSTASAASTETSTSVAPAGPAALRERASSRAAILRRDRLALFGLLIICALLLTAVFGHWLAPFPEQGAGAANVPESNLPPSAAHLFGTDMLGRDILSRVIMGVRPALVVSLAVVAVAALIGVPLGAIAGYRGGWLDEALMRVTEVFQSFPPLLLAMVMVTLLGPGLLNAGIALALSWWPWYARLLRAEARSLRERPYVTAAEAIGVRPGRILVRHIVRNSMTPILVQATIDIGTVVLAVGSLAFIGLGAQPPYPDWGLMVAEGRGQIMTSWWISTFPGLAIFVTVLAFNLLGDSLRDWFDPRQVKR